MESLSEAWSPARQTHTSEELTSLDSLWDMCCPVKRHMDDDNQEHEHIACTGALSGQEGACSIVNAEESSSSSFAKRQRDGGTRESSLGFVEANKKSISYPMMATETACQTLHCLSDARSLSDDGNSDCDDLSAGTHTEASGSNKCFTDAEYWKSRLDRSEIANSLRDLWMSRQLRRCSIRRGSPQGYVGGFLWVFS